MKYDNTEDRKRFAVVMNWLGQKFKVKGEPVQLSRDDLKDYFDALCYFQIEKIEWAAKEFYKRGLHFPKPKELIELAKEAPAVCLPVPKEQKLIGKLTPPAEAKQRLQAIFDELNGQFGTDLTA